MYKKILFALIAFSALAQFAHGQTSTKTVVQSPLQQKGAIIKKLYDLPTPVTQEEKNAISSLKNNLDAISLGLVRNNQDKLFFQATEAAESQDFAKSRKFLSTLPDINSINNIKNRSMYLSMAAINNVLIHRNDIKNFDQNTSLLLVYLIIHFDSLSAADKKYLADAEKKFDVKKLTYWETVSLFYLHAFNKFGILTNAFDQASIKKIMSDNQSAVILRALSQKTPLTNIEAKDGSMMWLRMWSVSRWLAAMIKGAKLYPTYSVYNSLGTSYAYQCDIQNATKFWTKAIYLGVHEEYLNSYSVEEMIDQAKEYCKDSAKVLKTNKENDARINAWLNK